MSAKRWYVRRVLMLTLVILGLFMTTGLGMATAFGQVGDLATTDTLSGPVRWDLCLGIAVSIGLPCLGAGYAVAHVGAAALGAASEKPELLTRSLLFVALAEGIAIYGLLMAILLYTKL